jgi:hypothetical protein
LHIVIYSYHGLPYDKSVLVSLMIKSPSIKFVLSTCGIARVTVNSPIFWVMHLGREPYPFLTSTASSEKHYEFNRPTRSMTKPPPVMDKRMPESMEVDHFRSQKRCYSCGKFGILARHCRGQERVGFPSQMHYPENYGYISTSFNV